MFLLKQLLSCEKRVVFVLFIIFSIVSGTRSQSVIDSLKHDLANAEADTLKVVLYNQLFWQEVYTDPGGAVQYAEKALELSKKTGYEKGQAASLHNYGVSLNYQDKYRESNDYLLQSIAINTRINYQKGIANSKVFLGSNNDHLGELEEAKKYYTEAKSIYETLGNSRGVYGCLFNIGQYYVNNTQYDEAIKLYIESLQWFLDNDDKGTAAMIYDALAVLYLQVDRVEDAEKIYRKAHDLYYETDNQFGVARSLAGIAGIYGASQRNKEALELYKQCLAIGIDIDNIRTQANAYLNIGLMYERDSSYQSALEHTSKAYDLYINIENQTGISSALLNLGSHYFHLEQYDRSLKYMHEALDICVEHDFRSKEKIINSNLAEIYAAVGDHKKAYDHLMKFMVLKDSIFNEEKNKTIAEVSTKYEVELKEKRIENLEQKSSLEAMKNDQQQRIIYGLIIGFSLVLALIFLLIKQRQLREKQQVMEMEQKFLRSQMSPHFIFNALMAIQGYIYKKDMIASSKFLAKFARLMRLILENSNLEHVSLEQEINTLEDYLSIQQLRFDHKFEYGINVNTEIETEAIGIPPMLAQPFIENALEHGIATLQDKGKINVNFMQQNGTLKVEISDNGIGRQKAGVLNTRKEGQHLSIATKVTRKRLEILNKKRKKKIELKIEDADTYSENTGTRVLINIPYVVM